MNIYAIFSLEKSIKFLILVLLQLVKKRQAPPMAFLSVFDALCSQVQNNHLCTTTFHFQHISHHTMSRPTHLGPFLTCPSVLSDNGVPHLYNLLDNLGCQGVKLWVGVDGTLIKMEDGEPYPPLSDEEALIYSMFIKHFHSK